MAAKISYAERVLPQQALDLLDGIGDTVSRARRARGESLRSVAHDVGATPRQVARVERGEPGASAGVLVALLHRYGANEALQALLDDTPDTQRLAMRGKRC